jgi:hypothetical protein
MRDLALFLIGFLAGGSALLALVAWLCHRETTGYCWPGRER